MKTKALCALLLPIVAWSLYGCGKETSANPGAGPSTEEPAPTPSADPAPAAAHTPTLDDFARAWQVDRTVADAFSCAADEQKPCHFGHAADETEDGSEWLIQIRSRSGSCGAGRRFDFTAFKSTPASGSQAPETTTIAFGELCEEASADGEPTISGQPKFRHGGTAWQPHFVRMKLKSRSGSKPFKIAITVKDEDDDGHHLHNGTGHAED